LESLDGIRIGVDFLSVKGEIGSPLVFREIIQGLNLTSEEIEILFGLLGLNCFGEALSEGPWVVAEEEEVRSILAGFLYWVQKKGWKSAKALAGELILASREKTEEAVQGAEQLQTLEQISIYTDGASRGNPGDAGIGIAVYDHKGSLIREKGSYIGKTTNNIAEYTALLEGIKIALEMNAKKIKFYLDSELVVKQVKGIYKVKNEGLRPLYNQVIDYLKRLEQFEIEHVPREQNKQADRLANYGIDSFVK
jgi:ribonuclease HI